MYPNHALASASNDNSFLLVLIGNVKEIIAQSTRDKDEYMKHFDRLSQYMLHNHVPKETVETVSYTHLTLPTTPYV